MSKCSVLRLRGTCRLGLGLSFTDFSFEGHKRGRFLLLMSTSCVLVSVIQEGGYKVRRKNRGTRDKSENRWARGDQNC